MSVVTITLFICLPEVFYCISVCFCFCSPFPFAFRDDSHLAFSFCSFPFAALSLMVLVYGATRFSTFLFLCQLVFFTNCCGMAKAKMATVRFKTPIARTNDFLLIIFYAFPVL